MNEMRVELGEITKTIAKNLYKFRIGDTSLDSHSNGTCFGVLTANKLSVVQYCVKELNAILGYFHKE